MNVTSNRLQICALALSVSFFACDKKDTPKEAPKPSAAPTAAPAAPAVPANIPAALLAPENAKEQAPAEFKVKVDTTKGAFTITVHREWAPLGADRFYNLVKIGFYNDIALFRVIGGFMAQFGIHGEPVVAAKWRDARIQDDKVVKSNKRGFVTFAMGGPNTRTTQVFINFADNARLDSMGFPPFGEVTDGMNIVDSINNEYGEGMPSGRGPNQGRIQSEGNKYLRADFPRLDYIKSMTIQ